MSLQNVANVIQFAVVISKCANCCYNLLHVHHYKLFCQMVFELIEFPVESYHKTRLFAITVCGKYIMTKCNKRYFNLCQVCTKKQKGIKRLWIWKKPGVRAQTETS